MTHITRKEWKFVWLVGLAVLILTTLPYVFGYLTAPADKQFMGLMQDVPDHGQYLSWWRSFQSAILAPNKLTPEPNKPLFFNLMWWLLAQVSRVTGWGYAPIYQILRFAGGALLFWGVYRLIAVLFPDAARRRMTFLLLVLSSGFGWLLVVYKYAAGLADLPYSLLAYNAESNYFLCLLGFPHFALAAGLIALSLEQIFRAWKENSIRRMVYAGLIAFVLGWMHAYDLIILYGVTGVFFLLLWISRRRFPARFFWGAAAMAAISVAPAIYSFLLTSLDPIWKEVLAQFANAGVYTPLPPYLFFLMGVPLFLAAAGLVSWFREKRWSDERLFIAGWLAIGTLLLYIPTDYQIHMLNSWQIPVMLLAAAGFYEVLLPFLQRRVRRPLFGMSTGQWAAALILLAVLPTNLYLWSWRFVELARHETPYYLETGYVKAMDWLRTNTAPEEVVLASLTVGQYVPAVSGNTAFLAHWANTVNFYDKEDRVAAFFTPSTATEARVETVRDYHVDYVLYGPAEQALGAFSPAGLDWLSPVYQSGPVTVYKVLEERLAGKIP